MIQVIERFHKIIDYIASQEDRLCSVSELAHMLDVSSPTCSNILKSMSDLGWLEQPEGLRGYQLGPMVYKLAKGRFYRQDIVETASPVILALCNDLGEYVNLVINRSGRRQLLMHAEPDRQIVLKADNSSGCDLYQHATGLAILANMSQKQREQYAKRFGPPSQCPVISIGSPEAFETICAAIRAAGYAEVEYKNRTDESSVALGFPVVSDNRCELAIGIQIPSFRFARDVRKEVLKKGREAAGQVARECYG